MISTQRLPQALNRDPCVSVNSQDFFSILLLCTRSDWRKRIITFNFIVSFGFNPM